MAGSLFNWKHISLGVLTIFLLGSLYYFGHRKDIQGFQNPSEPTFTMYYAPWCSHCKRAMPSFDELIQKSPLTVGGAKCNIVKVNPEESPDKAAGKPVKGFPTFLLEMPDGTIHEYQGDRSTDGYLKFINQTLGGNI
jgi:thiol-disulfide isomerase/thioredoxin